MKYLLITLFLFSCAGTKITTTTLTERYEEVDLKIAPDHIGKNIDLSHYEADTVISVPKYAEIKDTVKVKLERYTATIKTTTTFDNGVINTKVNAVRLHGKERVVEISKTIKEVPYCNRKFWILIGWVLGVVTLILIRRFTR